MARGWWMFLVTAGCDDVYVGAKIEPPCPPLFAEGLDGCIFDETAVRDVSLTFRDGDLEQVNAVPFLQVVAAGTPILRNVFVSPLPLPDGRSAADLYREIDPHGNVEIDGEFPVGTIIVHEAVNGEEGNAVQVRREDTWDDGAGRSWWFAKYFEDGALDENPCTPCVLCHSAEARPGSDGLWGVPRDAL